MTIRELAKQPLRFSIRQYAFRLDWHSETCPNHALGGSGKAGACHHCLTYKGRHRA